MFDSATHEAITKDMWKSNKQPFVAIIVHFICRESLHAFLLVVEKFCDTHCTQELLQ